ncbi:MAG: Flp pilus assembly protein CpaB [Nevskia sp.]|nr:Flp pilus assembly protein CpaB [Nevskia sp.]
MSSNLIKIIAAVFVVLAIILAFVGYRMSHEYADSANKASQQAQVQPAVAPQIQVVVATQPLLANLPIDRGSLKVVGADVAPKDYYANIDDVAGRTPLIDIDAGTPITPRLFKENNLLAKIVPAGSKAVSLLLSDVIGVGGFVRPGDVVDVLIYLHNDQGNKVDPAQARILLKDALVLASDDHIVTPPAGADTKAQQQQQQQQQRHERTVVVAVPDQEVTRVMLGASMGEVRLALHGQVPDQTQAAAAQAPAGSQTDTAAAPAAVAGAPTPVSGGSLPQAAPATAAAAKPGVDQQLPDQPYTSAELARLKPPHPAKGAPQGIVIYHGSKASTVYP